MQGGAVRDDWRLSTAGRYLDGRTKSLILDLTVPRAGERHLDIGCGSGEHLGLFRQKGCDVTGIDPSPILLDQAYQRLHSRAELNIGTAEDLPYSDNEFDIVTLITSLEFTGDPGRAIAEAIRVCRGRVFIGVMNRYSLIGVQGRLPFLFNPQIGTINRFFHLASLTTMIREQLPGVRIQWGSVIFLPLGWYDFATGLEERIPVMNNPFGAFFALAFSVTFTFRAIQEVIREPAALGPDGRSPMPGIIRERKIPAAGFGESTLLKRNRPPRCNPFAPRKTAEIALVNRPKKNGLPAVDG